MRIVALEAEAAHAGVELDVDLHLFAELHGGVTECLGDLIVLHSLRHIDLEDALRLISGRKAEHEDGKLDAVHAQLLRLVNVGDRKVARADFFQMLRHAHGAVPISVRLDDAEGKPLLEVSHDAPSLGLWAPAKGSYAPVACIEPWWGRADWEGFEGEFEEKAYCNCQSGQFEWSVTVF